VDAHVLGVGDAIELARALGRCPRCHPARGRQAGLQVSSRDSVSAIDAAADISKPLPVVLADDHAIVRSALRALLEAEAEFEVVAEASEVEEAVRKVLAYKPRVIVLDLSMPGGSSLAAIPRMLAASANTAVVVLTMEDEPRFAREALRAGALGFVLKESADSELVAAVRAALQGLRYLNPQLGGLIAALPETPPGPPDNLTDREVEVLKLVALGHTNAEVSEQLYLSVRTVESHRAHIQQKAGLGTRAELVAYAREHGLLDTPVDM
jgi:two-component system response regulator NreC